MEQQKNQTSSGFARNSWGRVLLFTCTWCALSLAVLIVAQCIVRYKPPSEKGGMLFGPISENDWIFLTVALPGIESVIIGALFGLFLSPVVYARATTKSLWHVFALVTVFYLLVVPVAHEVYLRRGGMYADVFTLACVAVILVTGVVLARWLPNRVRPGYCRKCGYNLTGNTSGICPECGTKTEGAKHRNRWES